MTFNSHFVQFLANLQFYANKWQFNCAQRHIIIDCMVSKLKFSCRFHAISHTIFQAPLIGLKKGGKKLGVKHWETWEVYPCSIFNFWSPPSPFPVLHSIYEILAKQATSPGNGVISLLLWPRLGLFPCGFGPKFGKAPRINPQHLWGEKTKHAGIANAPSAPQRKITVTTYNFPNLAC